MSSVTIKIDEIGWPPGAILLKSRRLEILQVDEALRRRQGWFQLACFSHELNDLAQSFDVQLGLLGNNAAIRVEIERKSLTGDFFR